MRESKINIIRNASINFHYSGNTDGLLIQQEVSDWCRNFLSSSIDSMLAEYGQNEEVIFIDKISLTIDLGTTKDWKQGLAENITSQFKERIHSKISSEGNDVSIKSLPEKFSDTLNYFLKNGILPWNSSKKSRNEFEAELSNWIKTIPASSKNNFIGTLREEKSAERFVNLLSQKDFETFLSVISDIEKESISTLFKDIAIITDFFTAEKILQQKALKRYKTMILSFSGIDFSYDKLTQIAKDWIDDTAENYPGRIETFNIKKITNTEISGIIRETQKRELVKSKEKPEMKGAKPIEPHLKKKSEKIETRKKKTDKGKYKDDSYPALKKITAENVTSFSKDLAEGVFIINAGIVIIAPFLSTLFSRTGLLNENVITDEATALSLLHFCIAGNTNPAEFELLLPKILLGIDPETFIDIEISLDEKQLKETNEMLSSVIEHWEILKDTSVDGLREAFLQRNGKLSFAEDTWLLQVEQKPFDMLLQHLPWNISMIRLPWMKHLLKTEWIS